MANKNITTDVDVEIVSFGAGREILKQTEIMAVDGITAIKPSYETQWIRKFTNPNTTRAYSKAFFEFCDLHNINNPADFRQCSVIEISAYASWLQSKKHKPSSVRAKLNALSSCYSYLKKYGIILRNPVSEVEVDKVDSSIGLTPIMTNEQVRLMLDQPNQETLKGKRDYAILITFFYSAVRVAAPQSINVDDYYEDEGFRVFKYKNKGGIEKIIEVHPKLLAAITTYLEASGHKNNRGKPLFKAVKEGNNKGSGLSPTQYYRIWGKYRKMAGLSPKFTPHSARATLATHLARLGVPAQDIQRILGHARIQTTQTYMHPSGKREDSAIYKISY